MTMDNEVLQQKIEPLEADHVCPWQRSGDEPDRFGLHLPALFSGPGLLPLALGTGHDLSAAAGLDDADAHQRSGPSLPAPHDDLVEPIKLLPL